MAFCPNCGTPNTDQAERCVACGFELIVPKQKAKFKGTIMMSGIKAPSPNAAPAADRAPEPSPATATATPSTPLPAPSQSQGGKAMKYQKTMMGQPPVALPPTPAQPDPTPSDLGHMPTMQGAAPAISREAPLQPDLSATSPSGGAGSRGPAMPSASGAGANANVPNARAQGFSAGAGSPGTSGSFGSTMASSGTRNPARSSLGGAYDSTLPPSAPTPNPAKVIAVGCAGVLALLVVVGGGLWLAFGDRIKGALGSDDSGAAEAAAWHASILQSLAKVSELCQTDCAAAGPFFHPLKQAVLLPEARAITPARLAKFNDAAAAKAAMLDRTEDTAVATQLGLDPQQCARVVAGSAKVISCSVPDPNGSASVLRIVQLSGVDTL